MRMLGASISQEQICLQSSLLRTAWTHKTCRTLERAIVHRSLVDTFVLAQQIVYYTYYTKASRFSQLMH